MSEEHQDGTDWITRQVDCDDVTYAVVAVTLDARDAGEQGMGIRLSAMPMLQWTDAPTPVRVQIAVGTPKQAALEMLIAIRDEVLSDWGRLQGMVDEVLSQMDELNRDEQETLPASVPFAPPPLVM